MSSRDKGMHWDGPPRKAVPRKGLVDQTKGKPFWVGVLKRKKLEGRYGGSGWDKSKIPGSK